MKHFTFLIAFFSLGILCLSGCENEQLNPSASPAGTNCTSDQAQIGVGDGFIENVCGCTGAGELSKGVQVAPANVTCTVASGTTIFFVYIAIATDHQIVSSGGLPFATGPMADPINASTHVTGALFSTSGTYLFDDAYDTAIQGKIVVQ